MVFKKAPAWCRMRGWASSGTRAQAVISDCKRRAGKSDELKEDRRVLCERAGHKVHHSRAKAVPIPSSTREPIKVPTLGAKPPTKAPAIMKSEPIYFGLASIGFAGAVTYHGDLSTELVHKPGNDKGRRDLWEVVGGRYEAKFRPLGMVLPSARL